MNPVKGSGQAEKDKILDSFARELFAKCQGGSNNRKRKSNNDKLGSRSEKKKSNADWVKSAATYDLINDYEDDAQESLAVVSKATASTVSSDKPLKEIRIKSKSQKRSKKEKGREVKHNDGDDDDNRNVKSKKKSSRREDRKKSKRRVQLSDSSDDEDGGIDVRKKYEYEKEQRRVNRDRRNRKGSISGSDNDDDDDLDVNLDDLTPEQRVEREREQDLKERDEFAKRLIERDSKKTPSKDPDAATNKVKKRVEMEQRLARGEEVVDETTGSKISLKSLREESRRAYLKQRTERELKLLEQELQDEEEMFEGQELTEAEKKRIELRKQILRMARDDKSQKDREENDGFYRLPDEYDDQEGQTKAEKDNALLKSRYLEEKVEKTEQQLWEEAQVQKAMKTTKKGKTDGQKEYDLVFDDKIDFVMTDARKGYDKRKKGKRSKRNESDASVTSSEEEKSLEETKKLTEHEKILAGRKKLPVYAYRDEFLSAVKDHQVLILVGETGKKRISYRLLLLIIC